jgi:hypothetical protein
LDARTSPEMAGARSAAIGRRGGGSRDPYTAREPRGRSLRGGQGIRGELSSEREGGGRASTEDGRRCDAGCNAKAGSKKSRNRFSAPGLLKK